MDRVIKTILAGDSSSLEKAMDRTSRGAKDMADDLDKAASDAKSFGSAIDNAADKTDKSERAFMGTADVLDGLGAAFGLPLGRATELGRAAGDLTGGFTNLAPTIKGFGASLNAVATGPMGVWLTVGAAIAGALVLLWKNCETFRDIVTGAFDAVMNVIGPVGDFIGGVLGGLGSLFGSSGDDAEKLAERQEAALEEMKAAYEEKLGKVTSILDEMSNPLERFNHANELTLAEVTANLRFNVEEYQKWADDIGVIRDRFGDETAQFVIDQGPEWHGLADQIANGTDAASAEIRGLIGTLGTLEQQAGQVASSVQVDLANMAQQLRTDLAPVNELLGGMFYPIGFQPTMPIGPGANRSPVITRRHSGGIVPGPMGSETPIIAQGGERIIPLGQSGGGTQVVQVVIDKQIVGEVVLDQLLKEQRRSGNLGFEAA